MKHIMQTIGRGQAGVYRVASELILRGHVPYFPMMDSGVDLILDGNIRIQVKATLRTSQHWRYENKFLFTLATGQTIRKGKYFSGQARVFSQVCDFVALWAIEANRFWIVPAHVLDRRHTVIISDNRQWRDVDVQEVKRLRADGLTWEAIAEATGISQRTLRRRFGNYAKPNRKLADMHKYEGRWDLIAEAATMLKAANDIASTRDAAVSASPDTPAARW